MRGGGTARLPRPASLRNPAMPSRRRPPTPAERRYPCRAEASSAGDRLRRAGRLSSRPVSSFRRDLGATLPSLDRPGGCPRRHWAPRTAGESGAAVERGAGRGAARGRRYRAWGRGRAGTAPRRRQKEGASGGGEAPAGCPAGGCLAPRRAQGRRAARPRPGTRSRPARGGPVAATCAPGRGRTPAGTVAVAADTALTLCLPCRLSLVTPTPPQQNPQHDKPAALAFLLCHTPQFSHAAICFGTNQSSDG